MNSCILFALVCACAVSVVLGAESPNVRQRVAAVAAPNARVRVAPHVQAPAKAAGGGRQQRVVAVANGRGNARGFVVKTPAPGVPAVTVATVPMPTIIGGDQTTKPTVKPATTKPPGSTGAATGSVDPTASTGAVDPTASTGAASTADPTASTGAATSASTVAATPATTST